MPQRTVTAVESTEYVEKWVPACAGMTAEYGAGIVSDTHQYPEPMTYYFVYILVSKPFGTLYVGVTNDLLRRVAEHREHLVAGFTRKYDVTQLVWYEAHEDIEAAILREKQLKRWNRDWKINLILQQNPHWEDLFPRLTL